MHDILLINPNTSAATTAMMVEIATAAAPPGLRITGATATQGVAMITDDEALQRSAGEVPEIWRRAAGRWAGVIVGAFGDPGTDALRALTDAPVIGICEASLHAAFAGGRRFGIATVTPRLVDSIQRCVEGQGLGHAYSGIRLTPGSPTALAADPPALVEALAVAIEQCVRLDGAEAVIIGGGPLARAAAELQQRFTLPLIAPIPAAVHAMAARLGVAR
jgi:Asp/Glu/hydantoin racemase